MYINPFLAGILATVFVEMGLILIWALWTSYRGMR